MSTTPNSSLRPLPCVRGRSTSCSLPVSGTSTRRRRQESRITATGKISATATMTNVSTYCSFIEKLGGRLPAPPMVMFVLPLGWRDVLGLVLRAQLDVSRIHEHLAIVNPGRHVVKWPRRRPKDKLSVGQVRRAVTRAPEQPRDVFPPRSPT